MDSIHINQYLWSAFLPPSQFPSWPSDCVTQEVIGKEYSPREAADRLDKIFDMLVEQFPSNNHIIPLSGGWDSRAILGALLERVDSNQITTVTFGAPGQLDYDLGKKIADSTGVKHYEFDLQKVNFTWKAIRESVISSPWSYVPDSMFNTLCKGLVSSSSDIIWSGFLGGLTSADHLSNNPISFNECLVNFSRKQRRGSSFFLCSPDFSYADSLPLPEEEISIGYDDALHFGIRQAYAIAPVVLPIKKWNNWGAVIGKEKNGAQVIAPFADSNWAGYWLSAPRERRKAQKLYLEMLNLKFPKLFSLPGKTNFGTKWNHGVSYMILRGNRFIREHVHRRAPWLGVQSSFGANYLNYNKMFRERKDYQVTLESALEYLKENEVVPWLNLDALWDNHMRRQEDHGDVFIVLLGLAANLIENRLPNKS